MVWERRIWIDGVCYPVVISDEQKALLAAKAAGRAVVGLLRKNGEQELTVARYLVETLEAADERYLERIVRRQTGKPWIIGESERLILREFMMGDEKQIFREENDREDDQVFYIPQKLEAYIRLQYGFYEYGLWAVVRKEDKKILGKAGITAYDHERGGYMLAYHIFSPYRCHGYGQEACRIILDYVKQEGGGRIYALAEASNKISVRLLEKLGFRAMEQKYSGSDSSSILFVRNC